MDAVFYWRHTKGRVFIRHQRSENSLASKQNSPAKFPLFPERPSLFIIILLLLYSTVILLLQFLMKTLERGTLLNTGSYTKGLAFWSQVVEKKGKGNVGHAHTNPCRVPHPHPHPTYM